MDKYDLEEAEQFILGHETSLHSIFLYNKFILLHT